ncbi:MAG: hypothetical protein ACRDY3_06535, partial [Acidimicrobiales bacterium]
HFHTIVSLVPPTPLGLLGARWAVRHVCERCHQVVPAAQLVAHAEGHQDQAAGEPGPDTR